MPVKKPVWCRPTLGYIGRIPKSTEGNLEWSRAQSFVRNTQRAYQRFAYSGPPDVTYNPRDGNFYPIFFEQPRMDGNGARNFAVDFLSWAGTLAETDQTIEWYADISDVAATSTIYSRTIDELEPADAWGDRTRGIWGTAQVSVSDGEGSAPSFVASRIKTTNIKLAALSIWSMPDLVDGNDPYREWHGKRGSIIRGNTGSYSAGDFGKLGVYSRISGDSSVDTAESATRRCLFQWGHPAGVWSDQNSFNNVIGDFPWPVYPRNLLRCEVADTRVVRLIPAVVVTASDGAEIKFTCGTSSITLTAGAYATPTLLAGDSSTNYIEATTGDDDTRYCTVEIKAPVGGEILLHTLSLWEDLPFASSGGVGGGPA